MDNKLPENYERDMFLLSAPIEDLVKELPEWFKIEASVSAEQKLNSKDTESIARAIYLLYIYASMNGMNLRTSLIEVHEKTLKDLKESV